MALMVVMLAMAVGQAFAQTTMGSGGFNDLSVVAFGGNCAATSVVEICDVNTGMGGL